jgi:DNA-binding NarL/FixJ family response regulator
VANKTLRLLVVEDSFEDERFLRELLEEAEETRIWPRSIEWEPVFAATAEEACDLAIDGSFDAILLNLSLPDSRVLHETFMSVAGVAAATPILVIADEPDGPLEALLLREGAQDFLLKSELDAEPLARRMKHAVERQRYVNSFSITKLADAVAAPPQIAVDTVPLDLIAIAEATLVE